MRTILWSMILCVQLLAIPAFSARAEDGAPELETQGIAALKLAQSKPDEIVAAAIYFGKAAAHYEAAKDDTKATEMNSFLYWCKKKMTFQQMDAFLKGGDASHVAVAKRMKELDTVAPPANDAQKYFDLADTYSKAHADEHLLIAIRFFEIANRFKGSEVSFKAQDRSLQEMTLATQGGTHEDKPPAASNPAAATPTPVPDAAKKAPVPSFAQQKDADKSMRELFKAEFAKNTPQDKLALAKKLTDQANETADDPVARYVLLNIAENLAAQVQSFDELYSIAENVAGKYEGDVAAGTKINLGVLISATRDPVIAKVASAFKTFLDKPDDAAANLTLGKYLLFVKNDSDRGLAMLAKSNQTDVVKIVKQETSNPALGAAEVAVGDLWWDLAAKTADKDDKHHFQARAEFWYGKALPSLTGISKTKLEKRIELAAQLQAGGGSAASTGGMRNQLTVDAGKGVGIEMVLIPAGSFVMGSPPNELRRDPAEKQHQVTLTKSFYMGKFTITQDQFTAVMGENPSEFIGGKNPVDHISFVDAQKFCDTLSKRSGMKVLLPSEAQWEYACRAGTKTPFYFGETISTDLANYDGAEAYGSGKRGPSRKTTLPVGSFKPNAFGLFDMHGNIRQWCRDWKGDYADGPQVDPEGATQGTQRVLRGGSYLDLPYTVRSASRNGFETGNRFPQFGFRIIVMPR